MVEEYKIMNISDGTDSKFGAIVIVKANPVTDTGFGKQFTPYIYANTLTFFFPANQHRAIRQLVQIANGGGFWQPNLSYDFQQDFIWDESAVAVLFGIKATDRVKSFLFRFIAVPAKWVKTARQYKLNIFSNKPYNLIWKHG